MIDTWTTKSVTTLPPGWTVTLGDAESGEYFTFPVPAILCQVHHTDDRERIVLALLNPDTGRIETFDDEDDHRIGDLVAVHAPEELAIEARA